MGNTGPTSLELLSLTGTQVQDLRPLVGLTMLEILMLDATFLAAKAVGDFDFGFGNAHSAFVVDRRASGER